jgi:hypothetical protein
MRTLESLQDYTNADKIEAAVKNSNIDNPFFALKNLCNDAEKKFGLEFDLQDSDNDWDGKSFESHWTKKFWRGKEREEDNYLEKMAWNMMDRWRNIRDQTFSNGLVGRWFRGFVDKRKWKKEEATAGDIDYSSLTPNKKKKLDARLAQERKIYAKKLAQKTNKKFKSLTKKNPRQEQMDKIAEELTDGQFDGLETEPEIVQTALKKIMSPDGTTIEAKDVKSGKVESIRSHDFRHNPDFSNVLATLQEHWGDLPPEDHRFKTLRILTLSHKYQQKLETAGDHDHQMVLRYAHGKFIFTYGVTHTPESYEKHGAHFRALFAHTDVLGKETYSNLSGDLSLRYNAARPPALGNPDFFNSVLYDYLRTNQDGEIWELDARNSSNGGTDMYSARLNFWLTGDIKLSPFPAEITKKFATAKYKYLEKNHPIVAEKLGSPQKLIEAMTEQITTVEALLTRYQGHQYKGVEILQRSFYDKIPDTTKYVAHKILNNFDTNDAIHSIKMLNQAKLVSGKGVYLDIQGAFHTNGKIPVFDNPKIGFSVADGNADYLRRAEIIGDNTNFSKKEILTPDEVEKIFLTREENSAQIDKLAGAFLDEMVSNNFDFKSYENIRGDVWETHTARIKPGQEIEWDKGILPNQFEVKSYDFTGKEVSYISTETPIA